MTKGTRGLYRRIAVGNLWKNARTYVPFLMSSTLTVIMFYLCRSLSENPGLREMRGGDTAAAFLELGLWVIGIFAIIFLFYTNGFLIKQRKREFGLYNILGMEKKHLALILGWETLFAALISLTLGIGLGIVLDKLMYLILARLLNAEVSLGFYVSPAAIGSTAALFGVIFLLIFLHNVRQVQFASPMELLRSTSIGEKEPKARWLLALLGIAFLASGYGISIFVTDVMESIFFFFVAVILVIIGTYLLFTAGIVALLKLLRKNKGYYYTTRHFISISGMLYRMKRNAVGLANICVLCTMVLVMISSTTSLLLGMEETVQFRCPQQFTLTAYLQLREEDDAEANQAHFQAVVDRCVAENGIDVTDTVTFVYLPFAAFRQSGTEFIVSAEALTASYSFSANICELVFVPLADYNSANGTDYTLNSGEVLVYSDSITYGQDTLTIFDTSFRVAGEPASFAGSSFFYTNLYTTLFVVIPEGDDLNLSWLYHTQADIYNGYASNIMYYCSMDTSNTTQEQSEFYHKLTSALYEDSEINSGSYNWRDELRAEYISIYGSLFFLGVFLGILFLMATVLIIYYKQLSEGYEDQQRFEIMQKVGLSQAEVRGAIRSQVLTVFFLPPVLAGIHVAFAQPIIYRLLSLMTTAGPILPLVSAAACFAVFIVFYILVYLLTSRTYYRIVQ